MSIRLLDSNREAVIDSIDLEYEDSFCLDTFGDLAQAFYDFEFESEDGKSNRGVGESGFIIARCQTWDHKQPGKMFFSYYNAFHLNKILFQTQVYLGRKLIHRLHVLNPLTNTDIIGNVQYFRVEKHERRVKPEAAIKVATGGGSGLRIDTESPTNKRIPKGPTSATVREIETGISQKWTMASASVAMDKDDEEETVPKPKKKMSLKPRSSITKAKMPDNEPLSEEVNIPFTPLTAPPLMIPPPIAIHIGTTAVSAFTPYAKDDIALDTGYNGERRHTSVSITSKRPSNAITTGTNNTSKAPVTPGMVTRFAVAVPEDEMGTLVSSSYSRRRKLSYANAVSAAGSHATVKEWMEMVKLDKAAGNAPVEDTDLVKHFGSGTAPSPRKTNSSPLKSFFSAISEDEGVYEDADETEDMEDIKWDAVLFATDTDFLEQSKTRLFFKNNAIVEEDAMLFKMKPFTGEEPAEVDVVEDDQLLFLDCCYPTNSQLNHNNGMMRTFHLFAALLIGGIVLFIYFTISTSNNEEGANGR